jgi:hypothetical protein
VLDPTASGAISRHISLLKAASEHLGHRDHRAASERLLEILHEEPNFAPALCLLARADWIAGERERALDHVGRALEIQPANPHFRLTRIQFCVWLARYREAEQRIDALLAEPWHPPTLRARVLGLAAELRIAQGRFADATEWSVKSLRAAPDLPAPYVVHGMNLLRLGRFEEGWQAYAMREKEPFFRQSHAPPLGQTWRGESLKDRSILLVDEQGFGDAIQFFRYISLLRKKRPSRIILRTFAPLRTLFADADPSIEIITETPATLDADFHVWTGSLPGLFQTTLATIPAAVPYLRTQGRLTYRIPPPSPRSKPKIGLVWSGDPRHMMDHLRSIPAETFLRIATVPNMAFYALQNVVRPRDQAALAARPDIKRIGEHLSDFRLTAEAIRQLDLVITVDTSVAHLAGALGKPVWILLARAADWRWLTERSDSPWYPTARLFRHDGTSWEPAIDSVLQALGQFAISV